MKQLKGKTAVLTGAASGFGLACAEIAADAGMNLVLLDVQADALAAVAERFEARGVPLLAQTVDVSDGEAMDRLHLRCMLWLAAPALSVSFLPAPRRHSRGLLRVHM